MVAVFGEKLEPKMLTVLVVAAPAGPATARAATAASARISLRIGSYRPFCRSFRRCCPLERRDQCESGVVLPSGRNCFTQVEHGLTNPSQARTRRRRNGSRGGGDRRSPARGRLD